MLCGRGGGFYKLAGPHREEVSANDKVNCVFVDVGSGGSGAGEFPKTSEQFWCCRFLAVGRRIYVVVGTEEGSQRGKELGAVRDVKGAALEIVPERRSQVACGSAQSACHHGSCTLATKSS